MERNGVCAPERVRRDGRPKCGGRKRWKWGGWRAAATTTTTTATTTTDRLGLSAPVEAIGARKAVGRRCPGVFRSPGHCQRWRRWLAKHRGFRWPGRARARRTAHQLARVGLFEAMGTTMARREGNAVPELAV